MKLYLQYFSIILKSQMQYKTSFFMSIIGQFIMSFSTFLGMYFMFDRFDTVNGFSFSQVLLCFATILMSFSIAECFVRGFDVFSTIISNGEFDRIMVRPKNEIFQVLASRIEFARIGHLLQAIFVFAYAIPASGVQWTIARICTLVLMIIGGICLFSALFIIYASFCFFTIEGLEFMNIFTNGSKELGKYPLSIYGEGVVKFFTFIVPVALIQYYPLLYLLGHTDNILCALAPFGGIFFLVPSLLFWKFGVSHYKSTGS